jgi:hypothetical protein
LPFLSTFLCRMFFMFFFTIILGVIVRLHVTHIFYKIRNDILI